MKTAKSTAKPEIVGAYHIAQIISKRQSNAHKGDFGRVLLVAGCEDLAGASVLVTKAALNSLAALRAGTDIIEVAAPSNVGWLVNKFAPDIIVHKFPTPYFTVDDLNAVLLLAKNKDVVVIGPGLGMASSEFAKKLIKELTGKHKNLIIDADALKAINVKDANYAILTPHAREFEILTGKKLPARLNDKIKLVRKYATHNVILLKGDPDIIAFKNNLMLNYTGNPAMTPGGTGDVLTGLCAGFFAQARANKKMNKDDRLFLSACAAAYINGLAGDKIAASLGNGMIASDLLREIPLIINKTLNVK